MDGQDTPQTRQKLISEALSAIKKTIFLPSASRECIYDEFDPLLLINEYLENNLSTVLNKILDANSAVSDNDFVALLKSEATQIVGSII